jgi:predicted aspartyl protease
LPATYIYPFVKLAGIAIRPFVPVRITNPDTRQSLCFMALLDTGADACCFPKSVAMATGHDLKHINAITSIYGGLSGTGVSTWKHSFVIELLSPDRKTVVWKNKRTLIDCVDHDNLPLLLGYNDFLSFFKITFNYKTSKIIIELP